MCVCGGGGAYNISSLHIPVVFAIFVIIQRPRPHLQGNSRYDRSRSNRDDKLLKNVADLYTDEGQ